MTAQRSTKALKINVDEFIGLTPDAKRLAVELVDDETGETKRLPCYVTQNHFTFDGKPWLMKVETTVDRRRRGAGRTGDLTGDEPVLRDKDMVELEGIGKFQVNVNGDVMMVALLEAVQ